MAGSGCVCVREQQAERNLSWVGRPPDPSVSTDGDKPDGGGDGGPGK